MVMSGKNYAWISAEEAASLHRQEPTRTRTSCWYLTEAAIWSAFVFV